MFPYVDDVSGQVSSVDARYADAMAAPPATTTLDDAVQLDRISEV